MKTILTAWNNRSLAFKLTLLCCLPTLGLIGASGLYLSKLRDAVTISRTELDSMSALHAMVDLIGAQTQRQGAADPFAFDAATDVDGLYAKALAETAAQPHLADSHAQIQALAQAWPSLRERPSGDPAFGEHTHAALIALSTLRDESGLSYTPYSDSYHLLIGSSVHLPQALADLATLRADIQQRGDAGEDGRRQALRDTFRHEALAYVREMDKALALAADVPAAVRDTHAEIRTAAMHEATYADADALRGLEGRMGASATAAQQMLAAQSAQHLEAARSEMLLDAGVVALVLALIVAGCWYTVQTTVRGVRHAARVAAGVAQGDLDTVIAAHGRDEVGQLLDSMDTMQATIRRVVESQHEMAARHEAGMISYRCDDSAFPGGFGQMVRGTNALVASHIHVKMRLLDVMQHYAIGDLSVDMDAMSGERAVLTEAMHEAKRNLQAINVDIQRLADAAASGDFSQRGDTARYQFDFRSMVGSLNRLMDTTEGNLQALSEVLQGVARGDLSQSMEGEFHGVFADMRDDANTTIRQLADIVARIQEASGAINTAASEIAAGNSDLAVRTERQAANLEETAASMEELTSTVRQNAESARQANAHAGNASGVAVDGGRIVERAVDTMHQIEQSSRRIADIISVIDGIAFQTNILALNAAVEAARAGEQGRGFAVVASEVRALAQRSSTAAKEIKSLIEDSVAKITDGSALVGEAGTSMVNVVSAVQRVTEIMAEIAAASQEQATGIDQINRSVVQIDEGMQQNAALVEESSAAARAMEEQAQDLLRCVSVFQLAPSAPMDEEVRVRPHLELLRA
ncbi:methyl-accepting chemotaxis protein [Luteimonas sp. WGS1318]|uniref:methyl-accepting chemotaxis protein n=1 Tax=Luteimonas sp. WGS1318 TaxID=3366815 RepID=UPI00372CFCAA